MRGDCWADILYKVEFIFLSADAKVVQYHIALLVCEFGTFSFCLFGLLDRFKIFVLLARGAWFWTYIRLYAHTTHLSTNFPIYFLNCTL